MDRALVSGAPARPDAVVFDFYGTLTVSATNEARRAGSDRVADLLGVARHQFWAAMTATFAQRSVGAFGDVASTLAEVAAMCGVTPRGPSLADAAEMRLVEQLEFIRMVRDEVRDVLTGLRSRSLRIGVLSDCTHELPLYWPDLGLGDLVDATLFSVEFGQKKPHPEVYAEICTRLGVEPVGAWYVGDGGSNELTGASAMGMTAFHLVSDDAAGGLVYDREENWAGPVIGNLAELLRLVDEADEVRGPRSPDGP